jgi:hypothetical protein
LIQKSEDRATSGMFALVWQYLPRVNICNFIEDRGTPIL